MDRIAEHRRDYARHVIGPAALGNQRIVAAFEALPRENYLGPPPWSVFGGDLALRSLTSDPAELYRDVLVALAPERGINNGQPTLHARCIAEAAPLPGETVLHVGAGGGYYSAVLALLVGETGRVLAYEIEPDLAERARANLAGLPQVQVLAASAAAAPLPPADVIYVSAGATHPLPAWLDALKIGGRLVFPLTPGPGWGVMLLLTRQGESAYAARALMRVAFVACIGARDDAAAASMAQALAGADLGALRSLRRGGTPDDSAWCIGSGWWLSTSAAG